jgi:hypothetical protein
MTSPVTRRISGMGTALSVHMLDKLKSLGREGRLAARGFKLVLVMFCAGLFYGCGAGGPNNRLIQSFRSPDGQLKVVVYEGPPVADSHSNRQLALLKATDPFPDHEPLNSFFCMAGQPEIEVAWVNESEFRVKYPNGRVIKKEPPSEQVKATFIAYKIPGFL